VRNKQTKTKPKKGTKKKRTFDENFGFFCLPLFSPSFFLSFFLSFQRRFVTYFLRVFTQ